MIEKKVFSVQASERIFYQFYIKAENKFDARLAVECFSGDFFDYIDDSDDFEIDDVSECEEVEKNIFAHVILDADDYLETGLSA